MAKLIIEKEDLRHNIDKIKSYICSNENKTKIIAVVKGNSYGLGLIEYTKFLIDNGISFFAVSTIEEAIKLRENGIEEKILMLSSTAIESDVELLINNNIIITIGSKEDIEIAEKIGSKLNKKVQVHLKIDTGFGRYGFIYQEKEKLLKMFKGLKCINIQGTYSHYSNSYYDDKYTEEQFNRFIETTKYLKENSVELGILHICNSSAALKFKEQHLDAVRIGSAFLGRLSFTNTLGLKKIAYLEATVSEIKDVPKGFNIGYSNIYKTKNTMTLATIPVGYMDGINVKSDKDMFRLVDKIRYISEDIKRLFKKQDMYVKINDSNCKILGRIGTYHVICDVTNKNVNIGDIVKININPKFVDSNVRREYK